VLEASNWLNNVVEGESLVVRVHHGEESGSVDGSNGSVVLNNSPGIHGSVLASVVVVSLNGLGGNVQSSDGDVGSVTLQPLNTKVVDWVKAWILLDLELEEEAVRGGSKSGGHINGQVIWSSSSVVDGGVYSSAREPSVLDSKGGEWVESKLVWGDTIVRHLQH